MKFAIGGIFYESNTFYPEMTTLRARRIIHEI
jgi:hypothetical protein